MIRKEYISRPRLIYLYSKYNIPRCKSQVFLSSKKMIRIAKSFFWYSLHGRFILLDFVILFGGSLWEKEDGRCWWIWRSETDWWCSCRCFWDGTPLLQWNWFLWEMMWRWMKDCHRRQGWIPVSPLSRTSSLQILFLFVVSFLGWVLRVSCPVSE